MASKIQIRRGLKQDLPFLDNGEFGLAQDTQEVFVGLGNENLQLAKQSDLAQKANKLNYVYSKIKADGVTDDSVLLQQELSSLTAGDYFITPKGTSIISNVNMSTLDGVTLDFSATKFIEGAGTPAILIKLKNSVVKGLYVDGNRVNKTFDQSAFGLDYLIKVDNNCENVTFENTKLVNAPYCASMLGENLINVKFKKLFCENIGEHVFYKTGYLNAGKNIVNFICEDVILHNICINSGYEAAGHFVHVFKCANDGGLGTGYCENVSFKNVNLKQDSASYFGATIYGGELDLRNSYCDNITGDFKGIVSGSKIYNLSVKNAKVDKGFYTNANVISYDRITFEKCVFSNASAHVNLGTHYKDCIFELYVSSSSATGLKNKILTFENCRFNSNTSNSISHVLTDIVFKNCEYLSTLTASNSSGVFVIGNTSVTAGKRVLIEGGFTDSNLFAYTFRFYNTGLYVIIKDLRCDGRIRMSEQIKRLELINVFLESPSNTYTNFVADMNSLTKLLSNVRDSNGVLYDSNTSQ